jgi:hypothetical protein
MRSPTPEIKEVPQCTMCYSDGTKVSKKSAPGKIFCSAECLKDYLEDKKEKIEARVGQSEQIGRRKKKAVQSKSAAKSAQTFFPLKGGKLRPTGPRTQTKQEQAEPEAFVDVDSQTVNDLPEWMQPLVKEKTLKEQKALMDYLKEIAKEMQKKVQLDVVRARQPPKPLVKRIDNDLASIPRWFSFASTEMDKDTAVLFGNATETRLRAMANEYTELLYQAQRQERTTKEQGDQLSKWLKEMGRIEKKTIVSLRGEKEYQRLKDMRIGQMADVSLEKFVDDTIREVLHNQEVDSILKDKKEKAVDLGLGDSPMEDIPTLGKRGGVAGPSSRNKGKIPAAAATRPRSRVRVQSGIDDEEEALLVGEDGQEQEEYTPNPQLASVVRDLRDEGLISQDVSDKEADEIAYHYGVAQSMIQVGHQDMIEKGQLPGDAPLDENMFMIMLQKIRKSRGTLLAASGVAVSAAFLTSFYVSLLQKISSLVSISMTGISRLIPVFNSSTYVTVTNEVLDNGAGVLNKATQLAARGSGLAAEAGTLIKSFNGIYSDAMTGASEKLPLILSGDSVLSMNNETLVEFGRDVLQPVLLSSTPESLTAIDAAQGGDFRVSPDIINKIAEIFTLIRETLAPHINILNTENDAGITAASAAAVKQAFINMNRGSLLLLSSATGFDPNDIKFMSATLKNAIQRYATGGGAFIDTARVALVNNTISRLREGIVQSRTAHFTNAIANYLQTLVPGAFALALDYLGIFQTLAIAESGVRGAISGVPMPDLLLTAPYDQINMGVNYMVFNMGTLGLVALAGGALFTSYLARLDPVNRALRRFTFTQPDAVTGAEEQAVELENSYSVIKPTLAGQMVSGAGKVARTMSSLAIGMFSARVAVDTFYFASSSTSLIASVASSALSITATGVSIGIGAGVLRSFFGLGDADVPNPRESVKRMLSDVSTLFVGGKKQPFIEDSLEFEMDSPSQIGFDFADLIPDLSFGVANLVMGETFLAGITNMVVDSLVKLAVFRTVAMVTGVVQGGASDRAFDTGVELAVATAHSNTQSTMGFVFRTLFYSLIDITHVGFRTLARAASIGLWIHNNPLRSMVSVSAISMAVGLGMVFLSDVEPISLAIDLANPTLLSDLMMETRSALTGLAGTLSEVPQAAIDVVSNDEAREAIVDRTADILLGITNLVAGGGSNSTVLTRTLGI